jgi:hypothetical protein
MKNIAFLSVLIAFSSCGVKYHSNKIEKHTNKLISKGIVIPKDTVTVVKNDTLTFVEHRDDTTFITKLITKTITLEPTIQIKDRWQVRTETKYKYKTIRVQAKQTTKQVKAENRTKWWIWLLIGLVIGWFLNIFINLVQIFKLTK